MDAPVKLWHDEGVRRQRNCRHRRSTPLSDAPPEKHMAGEAYDGAYPPRHARARHGHPCLNREAAATVKNLRVASGSFQTLCTSRPLRRFAPPPPLRRGGSTFAHSGHSASRAMHCRIGPSAHYPNSASKLNANADEGLGLGILPYEVGEGDHAKHGGGGVKDAVIPKISRANVAHRSGRHYRA